MQESDQTLDFLLHTANKKSSQKRKRPILTTDFQQGFTERTGLMGSSAEFETR